MQSQNGLWTLIRENAQLKDVHEFDIEVAKNNGSIH